MIKLKDGWCIEADDRNYILQQEVITMEGKNKGVSYMTNATYHSTLKNAVSALMQRYQKETIMDGEITLSEAFKRISAIHDEFEKLLHEIEERETL